MLDSNREIIRRQASTADSAHDAGDQLSYNMKQLARKSGLSRSTLFDLVKDGKLRSVKAAGRRLVLRTDYLAYLQDCREGRFDEASA